MDIRFLDEAHDNTLMTEETKGYLEQMSFYLSKCMNAINEIKEADSYLSNKNIPINSIRQSIDISCEKLYANINHIMELEAKDDNNEEIIVGSIITSPDGEEYRIESKTDEAIVLKSEMGLNHVIDKGVYKRWKSNK